MININYKVLKIIILVVYSFVNNLIIGFDNLKELNDTQDLDCLLISVDPSIEVEKPLVSNFKLTYKYLIFYFFFYNIDNPLSVLDIINYT